MTDGTVDNLLAFAGLSTLGSDPAPLATEATARKVADLRRNGTDPLTLALLRERVLEIWRTAGVNAPAELWRSTDPAPPGRGEDENIATRMLALIDQHGVELFHDERGSAYARVPLREGPGSATYRLGERSFSRWMARTFFEETGSVPPSASLADASRVLEGKALFASPEHRLQTRFATDSEDTLWIDMTDDRWRALRVTPGRWEVVDDPPPLFRRFAGQQPLPDPVSGGDPTLLLKHLNLADDDQAALLLVYTATIPLNLPRPSLVLHGPQGSAKTTNSKLIRRLWDPAKPEVQRLPRDLRELAQMLDHHAVPVFDNLDGLSAAVSDELAAAVTGAGTSKRRLYTDEEDVIFDFRRALILNGINPAPQRADLLDRSLLIRVDRIEPGSRRPEQVVVEAFERDRPAILGGLLDALAAALERGPAGLESLPRMADWAAWGATLAYVLGVGSDRFLTAYSRTINAQVDEAISAHPVGEAVRVFMDARENWTGTSTELLRELERIAEELGISVAQHLWPKAPNALSRRLNEISTSLREAGIMINRDLLGDRLIRFGKVSPEAPIPQGTAAEN